MPNQLIVVIELEPNAEEAPVTDALNETFYSLEAAGLVYDWNYAR